MNELPDWLPKDAVSTPNQVVKAPAQSQADVEPRTDDGVSSPSDEYIPLEIDGVPFPRQAAERIKAYTVDEYADWLTARYKARTDQIFLGREIMGLDIQENPHRALANLMVKKKPGTDLALLDDKVKKRMILWPRGCAKTFFSRVEQMQWILNYPNIRLCFLSGGESVAMPQLQALKRHFSHPSAAMQKYFPEYVLKSKYDKTTNTWNDVLVKDWGTQHHFTVPARTNFAIAESTFTLATEEAISSGEHFDVIFCDDLQNNQNARTTASLQRTHRSFLDVLPLLMPAGYLILTGTRYSVGDVCDLIMQRANAESKWLFSIRDCYSTNCKTCGNPDVFHDRSVNIAEPPGLIPGYECKGFVSDGIQRPLCPVVVCNDGTQYGYTLEFLTMQKNEDEPFFYCQYMNAPQLALGEATFTEALLGAQTIHSPEDLERLCPQRLARTFCAVDLAYTTGPRANNSVIFVFNVFAGQLFIWHCIFGRWNASTRIDTLIDTLMRFRPQRMFIEANLNSDATQLLLETSARDKGLGNLPVEFLNASRTKDAKNIRIGNIEQILKARRMWLYSGMPGYDKLTNQLLHWPNLSEDDFADCLGMCCEAPTNFMRETVPATPAINGPSWLERLNQAEEPEIGPDFNDGTRVCGMD